MSDFMNYEYYGEKPKVKVFCPICGKPPDEKTVCPNCGLENLCGYHLYRFFSDVEKSQKGCPKCGPKCSMCAAQTVLATRGERPICSSCMHALDTAAMLKKQEQIIFNEKVKNILGSILPIVGLIVGVVLGFQLPYQKLLVKLFRIELPLYIFSLIWGTIGILIGSFMGTLISIFIKNR